MPLLIWRCYLGVLIWYRCIKREIVKSQAYLVKISPSCYTLNQRFVKKNPKTAVLKIFFFPTVTGIKISKAPLSGHPVWNSAQSLWCAVLSAGCRMHPSFQETQNSCLSFQRPNHSFFSFNSFRLNFWVRWGDKVKSWIHPFGEGQMSVTGFCFAFFFLLKSSLDFWLLVTHPRNKLTGQT